MFEYFNTSNLRLINLSTKTTSNKFKRGCLTIMCTECKEGRARLLCSYKPIK